MSNPEKRLRDSVPEVEETLRLIAGLPAPMGLEDRVHASVRAGLRAERKSVRAISWPSTQANRWNWRQSAGLRGAAAAAIVSAVLGGSWGVYSRVQPPQLGREAKPPLRLAAPGGFSNAGAMRTPQTLDGPVVAPQAAAEAQKAVNPAKRERKKLHPAVSGRTATEAGTEPKN
jgi:hypothetical protein